MRKDLLYGALGVAAALLPSVAPADPVDLNMLINGNSFSFGPGLSPATGDGQIVFNGSNGQV